MGNLEKRIENTTQIPKQSLLDLCTRLNHVGTELSKEGTAILNERNNSIPEISFRSNDKCLFNARILPKGLSQLGKIMYPMPNKPTTLIDDLENSRRGLMLLDAWEDELSYISKTPILSVVTGITSVDMQEELMKRGYSISPFDLSSGNPLHESLMGKLITPNPYIME